MAITITSTGLLISGCTPGKNVPGATAAGAVAGGLAGGLLFKGSAAGMIGGALLGGIIGNAIGNRMDANDRARMQSAVVLVPEDRTTIWTNTRTGVTYEVTPIHSYYSTGYYCREYKTRVYLNGRWQTAYGRMCQMPNGTWRAVE